MYFRIEPHKLLRREDKDLYITVRLTEAALSETAVLVNARGDIYSKTRFLAQIAFPLAGGY